MTRSLLLLALLAPALSAQPTFVERTDSLSPVYNMSAGGNVSVVFGDLDADGDLDGFIGAASGGVAFYRNVGALVIESVGVTNVTGSEVTANTFARLALGDLDGDGDLDLVAGVSASGGSNQPPSRPRLLYFENTGTPTAPQFSNAFTVAPLPLIGSNGLIPELGDVDGDGDADLLVRSGASLLYFENTGSPTGPAFTARTGAANPFAAVTVSTSPRLVDLDGDGDLDLAAGLGFGAGRLGYYENLGGQGTPLYVERTGAANPLDGVSPAGETNLYPAFADFDGDGDLDLALGTANSRVLYFENTQATPTGSGSGGMDPGAPGGPLGAVLAATNPFAAFGIGGDAAPSLGDLDGDGDLDMAVGGTNSKIQIYKNVGGVFTRDMNDGFDDFGIAATSRPAIGDQLGTPAAEITIGYSAGNRVILNVIERTANGGAIGVASNRNPFTNNVNFRGPIPAVGDLDGDGINDAIVRDADATPVLRYFVRSGATYSERTGGNNPFRGLPAVGITPAIGDVDLDGDNDVLVGTTAGTVLLVLNTPSGFVYSGTLPGIAASGAVVFPAIGDIDADGVVELLLGQADGTIDTYDLGAGVAAPVTASVQLAGTQGWRMVSAPGDATLRQLLDDPLWIQGIADGDAPQGTPTVYRWDEPTQTYVAPTTLDEPVGFGTGVWVYAFEDDDPTTAGVQGGFPKVLDAPAAAPRSFEWSTAGADAALSYTDDGNAATPNDGYNVLGVPGTSWLDWDGAIRTGLDPTVYVYDPAVSAYRTYTQGVGAGSPGLADGVIAPFQAFWVQTVAPTASLRLAPGTSNGGPFQGKTGSAEVSAIALSLRPDTGSDLPETVRGGALVAYGVADAADGYGLEDGEALGSPATQSVALRTLADGEVGPVGLSVDLRPALDGTSEVPLAVSVVGADGAQPLVLSWPELRDVPAEWSLMLRDAVTGATVDLRTATEYAFTTEASALAGDALDLVAPTARIATDARFTLVVSGVSVATEGDAEGALELGAPRPNPTAGRADVPFSLARAGAVRLAVYDALGREVAVLADGDRAAGAHRAAFDATGLAAGVYVVRLTTADGALVRRLTVTR